MLHIALKKVNNVKFIAILLHSRKACKKLPVLSIQMDFMGKKSSGLNEK